jgi:VCBS repeat-containing protein
VVNANGTYTYVPAADYFGADSFTYKVNDGAADSAVATISITVTPVNDPPVAAAAAVSTAEDTPLNGTLPAATDAELDALTFAKVADPAHGALVLNADGTYTYTPVANYNGPDSFTYKVNDGAADSAVATVTITVSAVNDAPSASNAAVTVSEDAVLNGALPVATDADLDALVYVKVTDPAHGTVVVNADGTYTYTPAGDYHGADSFTYKVNDGTTDSTVATVNITVTPVNDAPTVSSLALVLNEDSILNGTLPAATDADLDALSYLKVTDPAHGTVVVNANGTYTYTPDANYNGPDSFTFKVNDGSVDSAVATVTITVAPVDDAPVAGSIADQSVTAGSAFTFAVPAGTFTDIDSATLVLSATQADGSPLPAWLSFDPATGAFSGTPPLDAVDLGIRLSASDGTSAVTRAFTLAIGAAALPAQPVDILPVIASGDTPTAATPQGPAVAPSIEPAGPQFGFLPLREPVDASVPAADFGGQPVAPAAPFDINALPPTAAGVPVEERGFAVVRIAADDAARQGFGHVTAGFSFPVEGHRLFVYHGIPNVQVHRDGIGMLRVPEDAFAHTDPAAVVHLEARLASGAPLPAWLRFEGMRGTFAGVPPEGLRGTLEIEVIATDTEGRQARTTFVLGIEELRAGVSEPLQGFFPLGLDVDKQEAEKQRAEAQRQAPAGREAGKQPGADGKAQKQGAAPFSEQMRDAKATRDPLLERIARAFSKALRPPR